MIQRNKDQSDLNQLATFHYVLGGLGCFFSLFALLYVLFGLLFLFNPEFAESAGESDAPPEFIGGILVAVGGLIFILGEIGSVCLIISGKNLKKQKNYTFSFVMACIACLNMPLGTILGIFTILVLQRDSVKRMYETSPQAVVDTAYVGGNNV